MDYKSINRGRQLRLARGYRGYNQRELAENIKGLSQANLSKFEHGFKGQISDEKLKEVMSFLNWPVEWLDKKHPECYGL